jgi:8-oxo-dGTP pyrophosphatase MutT (NUDIX family)
MFACFSSKKQGQGEGEGEGEEKVPYSRFDQGNRKPLCFFGEKCTRKHPTHISEYSHNKSDYNGVRASKPESCKEYRNDVHDQSCLGGGHARVSAHHQPSSYSSEPDVKNAGLALFTSDLFFVLVVEKTGELNFPSGKREQCETPLGCAIREAKEEIFGFKTEPPVLNEFDSGILDIPLSFVKRHRDSSKTMIYVVNHSQPAAWFKENFCCNSECLDIRMMSIPEFISNVKHSPTVFRFPESMIQFAGQLKDKMSS